MAQGDKKYTAYVVKDLPNGKSLWFAVGSAFVNKDGSINVHLHAFPATGGKIQLRETKEGENITTTNCPF